jgi:hypothetical protein
LLTFHKIMEGCEAGRADAWQAFVAEYSPVFLAILRVYLRPAGASQAPEAWRATLRSLAAPGFEHLLSLDRQSEKELLLGLRRLALAQAALLCRREPDVPPAAAFDGLQTLLRGRPLAHQQILFLKFSGYDDATIEKMLRAAPTLLKRAYEEGQADVVPPDAGNWLGALERAWSNSTPDCVEPRKLIRIQEGQANWYDREPVERHVAACPHCLENWTALAEVRYWRREARPLAGREAAKLLEGLGLALARAR